MLADTMYSYSTFFFTMSDISSFEIAVLFNLGKYPNFCSKGATMRVVVVVILKFDLNVEKK